MRELLREYGLVIALIVVGMAGYLFFYEHKDDVLATTLDALGEQLIALVDEEAHKEALAARFDAFKQRVLAREVDPGQVESMAANVLNLRNSGEQLTPEEADKVLEWSLAEAPPLPDPPEAEAWPAPPAPREAPQPPVRSEGTATAVPAPAPEAFEALGERLAAVLAFNKEVHKVTRKEAARQKKMAENLQYGCDESGELKLTVDATLMAELHGEMAQLDQEMKRLEKHKLIVKKKHLAREMQAEKVRIERELEAVSRLHAAQGEAMQEALKSVSTLKHLEALGYRPGFDIEEITDLIDDVVEEAMEQDVDLDVREIERVLREVERELKRVERQQRTARRQG